MNGSRSAGMGSPRLVISATISAPSGYALTTAGVPGRRARRRSPRCWKSFRHAVGVPGAGQVAFELQVNGGLELFRGDVPADVTQVAGFRFDREPSAEASASEIEQLIDHPRHAFNAGEDELGGFRSWSSRSLRLSSTSTPKWIDPSGLGRS